MAHSKQLVVLVGGKGTRLGVEAKATPKPLMPITDDEVFLDYFLRSAVRQGFDEILLLAGHLGEQVADRYHNTRMGQARLSVLIEPQPMGTAGALRFALPRLAPTFLVANGDTLFDINMRALDHALQADAHVSAVIALRHVEDAGRYGSVDLKDDHVLAFREKDLSSVARAGLINGGIYALRRDTIAGLPDGALSIEMDLFPNLIKDGKVGGHVSTGYFLDIGLPETLQIARDELPRQRRKALFLDRDGVVNVDSGYLHKVEDFSWVPGAREVIREANDKGLAVIVVTNQAGIARGFYEEGDVLKLHAHISEMLHDIGAFVDDFYYCPYHKDAVIARFKIADHPSRKPNPGMILQAERDHNLDLRHSVLIGDQPSDLAAAEAAGVNGFLFTGENLAGFVSNNTII